MSKKNGIIPVILCSNFLLVGCAGEANLMMVICTLEEEEKLR